MPRKTLLVLDAESELERALAILHAGGLVGIPTETVYGLAADAESELAVRRLFAVKGRPATHPVIVHIASADDVPRWARDVPPAARLLAEACWPGPLTLVLRRSPRALDVVTGGQDTVGLRVPSHPLTLQLLQRWGGGLAAPSANRFGRVSPTRAEHVRTDLGAEVDIVLDGGPCSVGIESTIVDLSESFPTLLRPGGLPTERIESILGQRLSRTAAPGVRAPGLLPSHYAPRAGVVLSSAVGLADQVQRLLAMGVRVAAIAPVAASVAAPAKHLPAPADADGLARVLYAQLREADVLGYDVVVVQTPDSTGVGLALLDRLARAAASRAPVN